MSVTARPDQFALRYEQKEVIGKGKYSQVYSCVRVEDETIHELG